MCVLENMVEEVREMSVTQLRKSTSWVRIGDKFIPGDNGIKMTYDKIPLEKLLRPKLGLSKIRECIEANRNPVDASMVASLTGIVNSSLSVFVL